VHAITRSICPVSASPSLSTPHQNTPDTPRRAALTGLEVLETTHFRLQCFQTVTGMKFLLFTEPQQPNVDAIVRRVYELYADYVMKNPFYTVEMPIRVEKFDRALDGFIKFGGR